MRTFKYYLLFLIFLSSCSVDNIVDHQTLSFEKCDSTNGKVAYPNRWNNLTRSSVVTSSWEKWETVQLASGSYVHTPWNKKITSGTIPYEIRTDILPSDGWDLIAHTVNGYGENGMNYLIFHNHYTGILKIFYYLEPNSSNLQNTAIWKLHFENPQSFLAFTSEYARLSSDKSVRDIYLSNITKDDSKGYTVGWNCFQVELAYDPDFSEGSLQIIPMSMTTSSIKFTENFDSKTDGTIISTTTSNPLNGVVKGVASLVGAKAEDWVSDQVKKAKFGNKIIKVLSSGANSLVTSGVGAALGSFIGVFSKTTQTTQTVQLNTVGSVELDGELKTLQTGLIVPLSMSISVKNVGRLGVWCLTKKPAVLVNPYVVLEKQNIETPFWFDYRMYASTDWDNREYVVFNPDLVSRLGGSNPARVRVETQIGGPCVQNAFGTKYSDHGMVDFITNGNWLYGKTYTMGNSYYLVTLPFWDEDGNVIDDMDISQAPIETYIPTTPDGLPGARSEFDTFSDFISLFNIKINTKEGNMVSLYHKFVPYLKWDYSRFDDHLYLEEYPNVPIVKK